MNVLLGLVHGADFALSECFLGSTIFYFFIATAGGAEATNLLKDWPRKTRLLLGLIFLSSFSWLILTSSDMADSWIPQELWTAISKTSFGHLWCFRLVLIIFLFLLVPHKDRGHGIALLFLLFALCLPLLSVLSGHSGAQSGSFVLLFGVGWAHAVAVGLWSGGLWELYRWLGEWLRLGIRDETLSLRVVKRFSQFAIVSTGVIALSGLSMAYFAGVSLYRPWATSYGCLIMGKVLFFCAALLAAAVNQFVHLRTWSATNKNGFSQRVRREVRLEIIFLLVVFLLAGFLARTGLPLDAHGI